MFHISGLTDFVDTVADCRTNSNGGTIAVYDSLNVTTGNSTGYIWSNSISTALTAV